MCLLENVKKKKREKIEWLHYGWWYIGCQTPASQIDRLFSEVMRTDGLNHFAQHYNVTVSLNHSKENIKKKKAETTSENLVFSLVL